MGRRFIWQPGGGVTITEGLFELLETDQFQNSPFLAVIKLGRSIRRGLTNRDRPEEFSIADASLIAAPRQRNTDDEKKAIKEGRIPI